jgi:hypothetical protein
MPGRTLRLNPKDSTGKPVKALLEKKKQEQQQQQQKKKTRKPKEDVPGQIKIRKPAQTPTEQTHQTAGEIPAFA